MMDDDRYTRERIVAALKETELTETEAWQDLSALSANTVVDTFETFDDEIRIEGDRFVGPLTWYVILQYGQHDDDRLTMSESFPGSFEGHMDAGVPVIDSVRAEVQSFYD